MLELKGSSTLQYTYEWFEIYDKTVRSLTVANLYQLAAFLQHIAEQMEKDLGYGIIEKHFILTYHVSFAFSSSEPKAQGELLGSVFVHRPSVVCPSYYIMKM